jgi:hypothetical protein
MTQEQQWTHGKTLLALFIVIDLIVIGLWLFIYFDEYQKIATIVGGIWASVVAFLGFSGISGGKIRGLSELFGLRPVKYIGITLTILILVASPLFVLWEFDTHIIDVTTGAEPALIRIINNDTGEEERRSPPDVTEYRTRIKKGNYQIKVTPGDARSKEITQQVNVELFQLKIAVPIEQFTSVGSVLVVNPNPESLLLDVTQKSTNAKIFSSNISGSQEIELPEPGEYTIVARTDAPHFDPYQTDVKVEAGQRTPVDITLTPTTGALYLNPSEPDMVVFVNGKKRGRTPLALSVKPGSNYDIVLMKEGQNEKLGFYFKKKGVEVKGGLQTRIEPTGLEQKALGVIVLAPDPDINHTYTISDPIRTKSLGSVRYGKEVHVFPGKVTVKKTINGQATESSLYIELGQKREISP